MYSEYKADLRNEQYSDINSDTSLNCKNFISFHFEFKLLGFFVLVLLSNCVDIAAYNYLNHPHAFSSYLSLEFR